MTDVIVRPEGPLARGPDRRASIAFKPGGSAANQAAWLAFFRGAGGLGRPGGAGDAAANQAAWLASFGVEVDFVGRVGAADVESEAARLKAIGVTPWLAGDTEHETGRLIALIDPDGERSFLTDRGANDALGAGDIPDALIAQAALIHLSGYSFFARSSRAAV